MPPPHDWRFKKSPCQIGLNEYDQNVRRFFGNGVENKLVEKGVLEMLLIRQKGTFNFWAFGQASYPFFLQVTANMYFPYNMEKLCGLS